MTLVMCFSDNQYTYSLLDLFGIWWWALPELRENFTVLLQDVFLFSEDISTNIRLGKNAIEDDRIEWAAREVRATSFIENSIGNGGRQDRLQLLRAGVI